MKKIQILSLISVGVTLLIGSGCASSPVKPRAGGLPQTPASAIVTPGSKTYPVQPAQVNPSYRLETSQPSSVWRPTVISRVRVDAYVDENNRLWEPSYMYVVREQGGWNLDSVRKPDAYIPPENAVAPQNLPGMQWGQTAAVPQADRGVSPVELDIENVRITGLVDRSAERAARNLAGAGEVAIYDNRFGWVIVRQADFDTQMGIQKPQRPQAERSEHLRIQADKSGQQAEPNFDIIDGDF